MVAVEAPLLHLDKHHNKDSNAKKASRLGDLSKTILQSTRRQVLGAKMRSNSSDRKRSAGDGWKTRTAGDANTRGGNRKAENKQSKHRTMRNFLRPVHRWRNKKLAVDL